MIRVDLLKAPPRPQSAARAGDLLNPKFQYMKVTITNKKKLEESCLNRYLVTIRFVLSYGLDYANIFIPKNQENDLELLRFLEFLEKCKVANQYQYELVEDYNRYVDGESPIKFDWFYDPEYDCQALFNHYDLTYFDENGVEYIVDIERE